MNRVVKKVFWSRLITLKRRNIDLREQNLSSL